MAEIVKNLSEGSIELPQVSAPGDTVDKLYNVAGALTFNGTDISSGGGIDAVIDDTSPQLGGDLDLNNFDIIGAPAASVTSAGGAIDIIAADGGATSGDGGAINITAGEGVGPASYGGKINITAGHSENYIAGTVTIKGGQGAFGGGYVLISGGAGTATEQPGPLLLRSGGTGTGPHNASDINIEAGDSTSASQLGGDIRVRAGDSTGTNTGGTMGLYAGAGAAGSSGGRLNLRAGVGGNTGGHIDIKAGNAVAATSGGSGGDITLDTGSGNFNAGTQEVDVGGTRVGGDTTGLANDATVYTASVVVDGGSPQAIDVTGSAAQTYTTLLTALNDDTTGAVWSLTGGNLLLTSDSTGVNSSIAITDTDVFSTLTEFVAVDAATAGTGSGGAIIITTTTTPSPTTNRLYNIAGALYWDGTDLTAGGGLANVVEDLTPELGGDLDVNGYSIISAAGSGVGAGGPIAITSGVGGSNGPGGTVSVTAGAGGSIEGDGGVALLSAGDGGTAGSGGTVNIVGGDSSTSAGELGGDVYITSGASLGNSGFSNHAGSINLIGADYATNGGDGGEINITAGKSLDKSNGAHINITAGIGYECNNGGTVFITGGEADYPSGYGFGGEVVIKGGVGTYSGDGSYGGNVHVEGGVGNDGGGDVFITGGDTTFSSPGNIILRTGKRSTTAVGNVRIQGSKFGGLQTPRLEFVEVLANGSTRVSFQAPAQLSSGNVDLLLPAALPSENGQALVGTTGGVLSFATVGGGGGGLTVVVVTATSATAAAAQATMVDDDTAAGVVTITLPAGSANDQQVIKKLGTTADVIVDGDSAETIDGAATFTLTAQYASLSLIWNGTEWSII
jgi:hypothetical protein